MKTILALYRGASIAEAKIIAVSVDPDLVAHVAGRLLESQAPAEDPVIERLDRGRRGALRAIQREADQEGSPEKILRGLVQGQEGAGR